MHRAGWPAGLQERKGYYSWRNPLDGVEHGIGRNSAEAFAQAVEANNHILNIAGKRRLIDVLTGSAERTVDAWCTEFETATLAERKLAKNTRASNATRFRHTRALLGADTPIRSVGTLAIADALKSFKKAGKDRTAQSMRSFWLDLFRAAEAAGWIDKNPVTVTEKIEVEVQRARLTFDIFSAIYAAAKQAWLRNAMALALVSAQRRENVAGALFADFKDDGWWLRQGKTGKQLILPLELRLDRFGMSLGDVLRQCRRSGALSKYLIHQTRPRGNSPVGRHIFIDRISKGFADARDRLDLTWGDKEPATFHEIRSLAERMYHEQGNVNTQELLGHSDPETTQLYHDARGAEWTRVKVG